MLSRNTMERNQGGRSRSSWLAGLRFAAALGVVLGFVCLAGSALALDDDDPDPNDPSGGIPHAQPDYVHPSNGFDWSAENRWIQWSTAWNERDEYNPYWEKETYNQSYVNPPVWRLIMQGCQSENDFLYDLDPTLEGLTPPTLRYQWTWNGKTTAKSTDCYRYLTFPAEGQYTVTLKVFKGASLIGTYTNPVEIKDYLVVVLGDSSASGEGAPDTPLTGEHDGSNADWVDDRCHRSGLAGGSQAARRIEDSSSKTSVTFISFACSGATLDTESWAWTSTEDPYEIVDYSPSRGTGITGPYVGIEPEVGPLGDFTEPMIPAQTQQLYNALTNKGTRPPRKIDALIVAGGINDAKFANVAAVCVLFNDCRNERVGWEPVAGDGPTLDEQYASDIENVEPGWMKLAEQLEDYGIEADKKLALGYPAFFEDDDGSQCEWVFGDVLAPIPGGWFWDEIDHARNSWAPMLNDAVSDGAYNAQFDFVGGIQYAFDNHGMCADNRYINTANDAAANQGADDGYGGFFADMSSTGTAHPNMHGYSKYADLILEKLTDLTENSAPIAGGDHMWVYLGLPYYSNWMNVLDNDHDPDPDDTLSTRLGSILPQHGTAELSLDGNLTYKPNPGYVGEDTLTYELTDGVFSKTVFVQVTVQFPTIVKAPVGVGGTIEIGGLAPGMAGPFVVVFDKDLPITRGTYVPIPGLDRILYTAPSRRRSIKMTYTVISQTTDVTSPSYGKMVRGKILIRVKR